MCGGGVGGGGDGGVGSGGGKIERYEEERIEITELWSKMNFDYEITTTGYGVICVNAFHLN